MITLVTEPREAIFGVLREWGVERTDEGRAVYDAWQAIERRFPMVRATYNSIMPDHFHGIIFITVDGGVSLKEVVAFFAAEVERRCSCEWGRGPGIGNAAAGENRESAQKLV